MESRIKSCLHVCPNADFGLCDKLMTDFYWTNSVTGKRSAIQLVKKTRNTQ